MKKVLTVLVVIIMAMTLTACGSKDTEATTEINTASTIETSTETTTGHSKTYDQFSEMLSTLWNNTNSILSEFSKNPYIDDEFLSKMEELNSDYEDLEDIFYSVEFNKESTDLSVYEYDRMDDSMRYFDYPMLEIDYDDIWNHYDYYTHMDYDPDIGWYCKYSTRYADGIFEISDDIAYSVEWFQNVELLTDTDPTEIGYRAFKVKDTTKDAYILIHPLESHDQLIRILPVEL